MKKNAWSLFSKIRRLEESDEWGMCNCVTCGKRLHWKQMHCGHFIHNRASETFLDPQNTHPQCEECNTHHFGRPKEYRAYIDKRYGKGTADEIRRKSRQTMIGYDWAEIAKKLRTKYDELCKTKSL